MNIYKRLTTWYNKQTFITQGVLLIVFVNAGYYLGKYLGSLL